MGTVEVSPDGSALSVFVPLSVTKRGGRKLVVLPEGAEQWSPARPRVDNTLVKAIARAHRWKRMLDSGEFVTMKELAAAEKINPSYLARILRLAQLAPDLVEAILDGRQPAVLQQNGLKGTLPDAWEEQRRLLRSARSAPSAMQAIGRESGNLLRTMGSQAVTRTVAPKTAMRTT